MALTTDILASYRRPRVVLRRLQGDRREGRILVYLMLGCALIFIAQWPRLTRQAQLDDAITRDEWLAGALFGWIFIAPLAFYVLAGLLSLLLRLFGPVDAYAARLGLFWAVLAASPLMLLHGMAAGLIGPGTETTLLGLPAVAAFVVILIAGLRVALETRAPEPT
ncbi:MAG: YIP1 family protein [Pararhodobacter sp.]